MRLPTTPATTLLRALRDEVRQRYRAGRIIVAVDGIDGAGKTRFADGLAEAFAEEGTVVLRASLDGFQRPRADRSARGHASADGYYLDTFDYATFRRVLVDPFRTGVGAGFQLAAFDASRDTPLESQWVTAPRDAVLVVDGAFLQRGQLRGLWDWSVWLEVPVATAFQRLALRDGSDPDPDAPANGRSREAWSRYTREAGPRQAASAIVDNADPAHPIRISGSVG